MCPRCEGDLDKCVAFYRCPACGVEYPVILGIPDFRVFPDPWIGFEDDRSKATILAELVADLSFDDAVREYWRITPKTPRALANRYIEHVLTSETRAAEWLDLIDATEPRAINGEWLDVGCGTGGLIAAAATKGVKVVGVDIALRWLVVAKNRPAFAHETPQLVCANGEFLPFRKGTFSRVVSVGTLEHSDNAGQIVAASYRVLKRGGSLHVRTVNRYSLTREPHVHVWGVGMVPRRWADRYVQLRTGQRYLHHRPLSAREVRLAFERAGFVNVRVAAATLLNSDRAALANAPGFLVPLYGTLRRTPFARAVVKWVAPLVDAWGTVSTS